MWRGLPFAVAVQLASAILPPPPPPPPPLPPGIGCSGETIFTSSTGSHTVTFDTDLVTTLPGGTATLDCAFVILTPNVTQGLLINFMTFDLDIGGPCVGAGTYLDVYDHTTNLETMLAHLTCRLAPPIASTNGSAMLLFRTVLNTTGTFTFTWAPASPSCGNGICENSADEYDLCMQDCNMSSFVLEHANTMWCEDYDRLVATTVLGASISIPYTLSHFGPGLPPGGLTVDLANILPADACSEVTSVTRSANITTRPIGERPKRPHPQLPHPKAPAAPLLRCKCRTPFSAANAAPPSPLQLPHPLLRCNCRTPFSLQLPHPLLAAIWRHSLGSARRISARLTRPGPLCPPCSLFAQWYGIPGDHLLVPFPPQVSQHRASQRLTRHHGQHHGRHTLLHVGRRESSTRLALPRHPVHPRGFDGTKLAQLQVYGGRDYPDWRLQHRH